MADRKSILVKFPEALLERVEAWASEHAPDRMAGILALIERGLGGGSEKSVEVARRALEPFAAPKLNTHMAPFAGDLPKRGYGEVAPRAKPGKAGFGKAKS